MIVMKFGGTSVADARALSAVLDIVVSTSTSTREFVVVLSATSGTTNALLDLARSAAHDTRSPAELCASIIERHRAICNELLSAALCDAARVDVDVIGEQLIRYVRGIQLLKECTDRSLDTMAAFGELFSTTIFTYALKGAGTDAQLVHATQLIRTDDAFGAARVDFTETTNNCQTVLKSALTTHGIVVTQGFVGSTEDGITTTLGRGGSDYSAAILGACGGASEIQIWTDVSGVYSADPRIVPNAQPIPTLSYGEVRELALYGAKVLHPATIAPAIDAGIPVHVLNTFRPNDPGTRITSSNSPHSEIHALSLVRDCVLIRGAATEIGPIMKAGHLADRAILEEHSIERVSVVAHVPTSEARTEIEVSIAGRTTEITDCSVIIATGPGATQPSSLSRLLGALNGYRILAIMNGMSDVSVFFVCDRSEATNVLLKLHELR